MYMSPINNHLLATMSEAELQPLRARLNAVELQAGAELHAVGSVVPQVHFPVTATVSLTTALRDGSSLEVAAVGNEGMVGVCAFLGGGSAISNAIVQRAGIALQLPAIVLREAAQRSPALNQQLLRYTQSLLTTMAQSTACLRRHRLEQHLCRSLLEHLDRQPGNVLEATQDSVAQLLGVRREGVTAAAQRLQHAGLIRYHRGRIELCDRAGLEARCCECYEAGRHTAPPARTPRYVEAMPRYGT